MVLSGSAIGAQMVLPWPYGTIITVGYSYPILIHNMLKWSRAWNASIDEQNKPAGTM